MCQQALSLTCCSSQKVYFQGFTSSSPAIWRRQWQATPVPLPRKSHGWGSLVGCSPWGHYESEATEQLHFHLSLSCNGEDGNPLQCSCLENLRDGTAWWAAVYGVAQSWTRLKQLSSSSSPSHKAPSEAVPSKAAPS